MDTDTPTRDTDEPTSESNGGIEPVEEGEEFSPQQPDPTPSGDNGGPSDEELLIAQQSQSDQLKDVRGDEEPRAGRSAVEAARDRTARSMSPGERSSALDWFLNEDPSSANETKVLELNFGTQDNPRWVFWTIKSVPMEVMRAVRRKAGNTRAARQTGEVDEYRVNLEIVVEGTVDPDVKAAAAQLAKENRGPGDPVDAMRAKFEGKPGYVAQLAGRIMTLSGFNDEDVRDAERAAKN